MEEVTNAPERAQILEALASAFSAGEYAKAETLARTLMPKNEADDAHKTDEVALYALFQALCFQHKNEEASLLIEKLLALDPLRAVYHDNLGALFAAQNRWAEAEAAYKMAITLDPSGINALFNLALAMFKQGRADEALTQLAALETKAPDFAELFVLRGEIFQSQKRFEEAATAFFRALDLGGESAEVLTQLGMALDDAGRREEAFSFLKKTAETDVRANYYLGNQWHAKGDLSLAEQHFRKALALNPGFPAGANSLGLLLQEKGDIASAKDVFLSAIESNPDLAAAHNNLGNCYIASVNIEAALACFERALSLSPDSPAILNNYGEACSRLHRLDEAEAAFRKAFSLAPDDLQLQLNFGFLLLLRGKLEEGFPFYEARWATGQHKDQLERFKEPLWMGEPLAGKTLLLYTEQGLGDNLQFVRYLPLLRERYPSTRLCFACAEPLLRLFAAYAADSGIELLRMNVPGGLPTLDYHLGLLSLPHRLGTTLATIPAQIPYLTAPSELIKKWGDKLNKARPRSANKRIGIVWASGEGYTFHKTRTLPLAAFLPFFALEGIDWISLQKGRACQQIADNGLEDKLVNLMDEVDDVADSAAIITHLDLLISVDTSVPHLAGALGVPVWLLDRLNTDWRWMLERSDSPWYPTMRLFRQTTLGDWSPVLEKAQSALQAWLAGQYEHVPPRLCAEPIDPAERALQTGLKLNLGCGNRHIDGFVNVDRESSLNPDLVVDLEKTPWPWSDNSVEEVKLIHVLEHLGQETSVFLAIIKELYRVCQDGAFIDIEVPHPRSDGFIGDPTHVRAIIPPTLNLFNRRLNAEWKKLTFPNTPLGEILGVDFEIESINLNLTGKWLKKYQSGKITEAELQEVVEERNNVISFLKIGWRVHKTRIFSQENNNLATSLATPTVETLVQEDLNVGRFPDVIERLRPYLLDNPKRYDLECLLALAYQKTGQFNAARLSYESAAAKAPPSYELFYHLGEVHSELADFAAAQTCFERALKIAPDSSCASNTLVKLAQAQQENNDITGALSCYEQLLAMDSKDVRAWYGMGCAFAQNGWDDDARKAYETALSFQSDFLPAQNGLAVVEMRHGKYTEALSRFEALLLNDPANLGLLRNKAMLLAFMGEFKAADLCCDAALTINPEDADIHFTRGCNYLMSGRLSEGWKEFDYRWQGSEPRFSVKPIHTFLPRWRGESVDKHSDSLIIYPEQGFGDAIQFARYVFLAAEKFKQVRLYTRASLYSLFERSFGGVVDIVSEFSGHSEANFTHHCPILSLPLAFATTLDSIPAKTPYLFVDPVRAQQWVARLKNEVRLKIGLVWTTGKTDLHKTSFEINPLDFAPLFELDEICWVSLNKAPTEPSQEAFLAKNGVLDWTVNLTDFDDTAALVNALDLVISVDTAVAHLAGALNKPIWLLNRAQSEWRWMLQRSDSPWYPSMRIFRQTEPGN